MHTPRYNALANADGTRSSYQDFIDTLIIAQELRLPFPATDGSDKNRHAFIKHSEIYATELDWHIGNPGLKGNKIALDIRGDIKKIILPDFRPLIPDRAERIAHLREVYANDLLKPRMDIDRDSDAGLPASLRDNALLYFKPEAVVGRVMRKYDAEFASAEQAEELEALAAAGINLDAGRVAATRITTLRGEREGGRVK